MELYEVTSDKPETVKCPVCCKSMPACRDGIVCESCTDLIVNRITKLKRENRRENDYEIVKLEDILNRINRRFYS